MGWPPSSRLAYGALGSQRGPRSLVYSTGQAERYLLEDACAKSHGALGHARLQFVFDPLAR